MAEFTVLF